MKLELRGVTFEGSHLDDACLFQEVEAKDVVSDLGRVLDFSSQRVHYVYKVVALAVHFVNFRATLAEGTSKRKFDAVGNYLRVRLVANLEDIFSGDHFVETRGCCLEVVQSVSHIALSSEN